MWKSRSWIFDILVFKNMMSESWISTTIQDLVHIMVFEMVFVLVQQVFEKQIIMRAKLKQGIIVSIGVPI